MNKSESIAKLAGALSKFQGACDSASREKQGHQYKYAELSGYIDEASPLLKENELAVIQLLGNKEGHQGMTLETILTHSSGEFISSMVVIPSNQQALTDSQKAGSAITYIRKYSYAAILGMTQADDDGKAASRNKQPLFMDDKGWQNHANSLSQQGMNLDKIVSAIQKEVKGLTLTLEDKNIIVKLINGDSNAAI
jgi:hypothetical protein